MKLKKLSRRRFLAALGAALVCAPFAVAADAKWMEPTWLKVRRLRIGNGKPTHRLVHFTDLHHKGDRKYLQTVVNAINSLAPDFVCFTGDIVEEQKFLPEALEILSGIKSPMFGVPGNHDYWSRISFAPVFKCFAATGGAWLLDEAAHHRRRQNQPHRRVLHSRAPSRCCRRIPRRKTFCSSIIPRGRRSLAAGNLI